MVGKKSISKKNEVDSCVDRTSLISTIKKTNLIYTTHNSNHEKIHDKDKYAFRKRKEN